MGEREMTQPEPSQSERRFGDDIERGGLPGKTVEDGQTLEEQVAATYSRAQSTSRFDAAILRGAQALAERDRRYWNRLAPGAAHGVSASEAEEYKQQAETVLRAAGETPVPVLDKDRGPANNAAGETPDAADAEWTAADPTNWERGETP